MAPLEVTVAVLADTHLGAGALESRLPPRAWPLIEGADVILHAGDLTDISVVDALRRVAPVHAVRGNNDRGPAAALPATCHLELGGVRIGMIHDSGAARGRAARMHRRFPEARVVVFGHSHVPVAEAGAGGQLLFNPGSPTQKRRQPAPTVGWLRLSGGRVVEHAIVAVA